MSGESDQLRRSWIANASAWSVAVREHRIESRRTVTDAAIVAAVLAQNPRRVLDVGCGEGWLARALSAHGIDVTGIDASAPLIEAARALGGGEFLEVSYEALIANPSLMGERLRRRRRELLDPRRSRRGSVSRVVPRASDRANRASAVRGRGQVRRWLAHGNVRCDPRRMARIDAVVLPHDRVVASRVHERGLRGRGDPRADVPGSRDPRVE